MTSLRHECPTCFGLVGFPARMRPEHACTCPPEVMPTDPDELMGLLKGCTVAEYGALREKMIQKGRFL